MDSPLDRPSIGSQIAPRAPALRARITNHEDLLPGRTPPVLSSPQIANPDDKLPGLFSKSAHARRYRDLVDAFLVDVGGAERCSEIKLSLIRRLAAVTVQAELLESKLMNSVPADLSQLCTLASTTVRLAQRIGIERAAKLIEPPPTVDAYLHRNGKYGASDDGDDAELAQ
jgi:hypothetical protein